MINSKFADVMEEARTGQRKIEFMSRPNMSRIHIKLFKEEPFNLCKNSKTGICSEEYNNCSAGSIHPVCRLFDAVNPPNISNAPVRLKARAHIMRGFANYQLNKQLIEQ
jgi:hypothetical protein